MRTRQLIWLAVIVLLAACGGSQAPVADVDVSTLGDTVDVQTVAAVKDSPDVFVVDVREQWEYDAGHIPGVTLIPMDEVPDRLADFPTDKEVILTCRSGNRSGQVAQYLRQLGYENIHNMEGGIVAWEAAGLPTAQ